MDEAAAYNNLGYIYMMDGKYDEAENYFQQAITSSPSHHAIANENLNRLRALRN